MLKVFLALIFIVILIAPGAIWWVAQRPVPVLEGIGELSGLSKPVLTRYDSRAIPYVKADSEQDLYAAQGYLVARERMFQMDILRRAAEGRFAEVFGLSALSQDRLMCTIGFERIAKEELAHLSEDAKAALSSYTRGVNAFLQENPDKLALEFTVLGYKPERWEDVDSLAIMKYLAYELDESWKLDQLRWQVRNKLGDNMASILFNDSYAVSAWSPEVKVQSPLSCLSKSAPQKKPDSAGGELKGNEKSSEKSNQSNKPAAVTGSGPRAMLPPGLTKDCNSGQRSISNLFISDSLRKKIASLAEQKEFFRQAERTWGSTAWVLAPAFSKSNGAMIAADKHTALTVPGEYFLISLSSPKIHVAGATIPGIPGVIFGRNDAIAWGGASMHADVQDLFVEHFASELDIKYKSLSKVETAKEFREAIPVRFGNDVEHKVTITKHGPVLLRDKDSAIALSWTGFDSTKPWLNTICALNRASDWSDFNKALSAYGGPTQLFVYADRKGNSGSHAAGIIPVRARGADGTTMSEGWLENGEWVAAVPYDEMPQSFAGPGGAGKATGDFAVAAGQKLFAVPGNASKYPQYWGKQWDAPYRANRLALSLPKGKNAQKLDLLDFNAYQGDEFNMIASFVVAELKKSIDANKSIDSSQVSSMQLLQNWDFIERKESAPASIYESFVGTLARRLIEPKLGREMANSYFENWPLWITFVEYYLRQKPQDWLPSEERTHDTFMLTTFAKANTRLKLLFKDETNTKNWLWSNAHLAKFRALGLQRIAWLRYLLDIRNVGVGGSKDCLNACDIDRISVGGAFASNNGPTVRLLIDMADSEAFYGTLALGQSGHYFSPYRQDQLRSWLKNDPLAIAFSETQIDKQCRAKFYLSSPGYRR